LGLVAVVFSSMTVCVTRTDVKWWLDFGLLKGRIALSDIASVQIETVPFYRGYGIRTNGRTHIWRINGLKCVVLARRNGAKVILGAADPNRLIAAIELARGESHPTG
jgi:hypothetical protein